MPSPSLPSRPNLEQLKNRAKDLLKAYRDGQPAALARLRASLPRCSHLSDDDLFELSLSLRDAQRVIAIEHGFEDWLSMRTYIERKDLTIMLEMTVDHVRVSIPNNLRVVVLKGKEVNRYLPIWVGQAEGDYIALTLQGQSLPRPMTHDLMDSMIRDLGATVTRVVVSDMSDDTFIAYVALETNGATVESDSRASDAIALAVRCGAPVFASSEVLDKSGIDFDPETGEPTSTSRGWPEFSILAAEGPGRHNHDTDERHSHRIDEMG